MPIIKKRDSYRWTVKHTISQRAGKPELLTFDIEFKALSQSRVTELVGLALTQKLPNELFITETMVGWHDLKREDNTAWEFSIAAVRELCELYPGMPASLSRAWSESVNGNGDF